MHRIQCSTLLIRNHAMVFMPQGGTRLHAVKDDTLKNRDGFIL